MEFMWEMVPVLEAVEHQEKQNNNPKTFISDCVDSKYFKDEVLPGAVGAYLRCSGVQSRKVSSLLMAIALDTEIYPLRREADRPIFHDQSLDRVVEQHIGSEMKLHVWRFIVQFGLSIIALALHWLWIAFALLIYTIYRAALFVARRRKLDPLWHDELQAVELR